MLLKDLISRMTSNELRCLKRDVDRLLNVMSKNSDKKIENLNLSVRAYNVLRYNEMLSLNEITKYTPSNFMRLRNMGKKTFDEVTAQLLLHGLFWKEETKATLR